MSNYIHAAKLMEYADRIEKLNPSHFDYTSLCTCIVAYISKWDDIVRERTLAMYMQDHYNFPMSLADDLVYGSGNILDSVEHCPHLTPSQGADRLRQAVRYMESSGVRNT